MNTDDQTPTEPSLTRLVTGIVADVQDLLAQQLALFKVEIREDLHRAAVALSLLVVGLVVAGVGAILLGMMLVYLLDWLCAPDLPLWGSFAIVGCLVAALGAGLLVGGMKAIASLNLVPEQSLQELKEDVPWRTTLK
jgi:uncharacterized membrane protein YqjE